jgi:hypothetical protein
MADTDNLSWIVTKWSWKPSPRSIGFDADENGQSRQAQHQIPISPVLLAVKTWYVFSGNRDRESLPVKLAQF